jgi:hypothetical protein
MNEMKKVLAMCSSCHRPEMLARMFESYQKTTRHPGTELVVYVSETDIHLKKYQALQALAIPASATVEYGPKKTMVEVLNYFSCEKYTGYDYYLEVNDDHVFVSEGWDLALMAAVDKKNNGFSIAYGQTAAYPGATMHGGELVRFLGYFFIPIFDHMCVDFWLMDIGFGADLMIYEPNVLIEHRAALDKVKQDGGDQSFMGEAIYKNWVATKRAEDVAKLKAEVHRRKAKALGSAITINPIESATAFMTTYDRIDILRRTVDSYLAATTRPKQLFVFHDKTANAEEFKKEIDRIPEAVFIVNSKNYGSDGNIIQAQRQVFGAGAKNILALDSDCLFNSRWWEKTIALCACINLVKNIVSIINLRVHNESPSGVAGFVSKPYIGGLGLLLSKENWNLYVTKIEDQGLLPGWDGTLCTMARKDGKNILACSPSLLQHTGGKIGAHAGVDAIECIANDFEP